MITIRENLKLFTISLEIWTLVFFTQMNSTGGQIR